MRLTINSLKITTCFVIAVLALAGYSMADDDGVLTIGTKAPSLDIEHWISDADGAFEKTTDLKSGQVYVIEFWATWCGPCIASMPHIADTQREYGDDVQIISISDEDMKTVDKFLKRTVRGEEELTYRELTSAYCLTTDPDESVMNDYFRASGQSGIPCAFIVGKSGHVEWIGHPMAMDKPLKEVVNDEWDREKFAVAFKKEQEGKIKAQKAQRALAKVGRKLQGMLREGENEEAIELIDELLEDEDYAIAKEQLSMLKLQVMVNGDLDGAPQALDTFAKENSDNVQMLNQIAWSIYEQNDRGDGLSKALLKSACNCAKIAADAEPENGAVLDTYAHLIYAAHKDLDKAIAVQKKAVENAGPQIDEIQPFLDQLMKEKEGEK